MRIGYSMTIMAVVCVLSFVGPIELELYQPTPAARQDLQAILDAQQVRFAIVLATGNVPNAAATFLEDATGQPVPTIVYNRTFLNQLAAENPWAPISVLAHEVGHLVADHPLRQGVVHAWSRELAADRFSGCTMALLGAAAEDASAALRVYFDAIGSSSHPRTRLRLEAVLEGWRKCQG
jgi:hypothetical protein